MNERVVTMEKLQLIIVNVIFGLGILAWPFIFFMSIFLFDAPGSENSLLTLSLAYSIWTYPLFYGAGLIGSIFLYLKQAPRLLTMGVAFLPMIGVLWFMVSWVLIDVINEGKFAPS